MKKLIGALASLVLATSMIMTGCSTPASSNSGTIKSDATLVYWSMWNETEPQGVTIKSAIEDFTAQTGVKVTINWQGRDIRRTLQAALEGGETVDIFDEDFERVVVTWGNFLLPIDSYIEKSYATTNGKPYKDVVNSSLIELTKSVSKDGKLYGIPYQPFLFTFLYNKDLFDKAGITETPKTWDDFLAVCEKLKGIGVNPLTVDDAYVDCLAGTHLSRLVGPEGTRDIVTNNKWDDPSFVKMAQDWEDVYKKGYISKYVATNVWPTGQAEIADGTTAMYFNGSWLPNEILDQTGPDFRWGSFAYPELPGGKTGAEATNYGSQLFGVNKDTKYPDEAVALLVHLTTGKWDVELAKNSLGVPVAKDSAWPEQLKEAKVVFDGLKVWYPWAGGIQANTDKQPIIVQNFTKLLSGSLDAQGFVGEMKK